MMAPESARHGRRRAALRKRLRLCLGLPAASTASQDREAAASPLPSPASPVAHSWSDTEVLTPASVKTARRRSLDAARSPPAVARSPASLSLVAASPTSSPSSSPSSVSSAARKGVQYDRDGELLCCRFCDILRSRGEQFLYENEELAVFRPLAPAVESHILVVPRCHIRNVNQLTEQDSPLLQRMRDAAQLVLRDLPRPPRAKPRSSKRRHPSSSSSSTSSASDVDCKLAFHTPPFNSIDHVHMHAFLTDDTSFGCVGSIKYRTATWWCRSFDEVMARLDQSVRPRAGDKQERARPAHSSPLRRQHKSCSSSTVATDDVAWSTLDTLLEDDEKRASAPAQTVI